MLALVVAAGGCITPGPGPGQPRMRAALDELRAARAELEQATATKGGHRDRAMAIVDQAIAEVEQGMEFARERR